MSAIAALACAGGAAWAQAPAPAPFRVGVLAEAASPCAPSIGIAGADTLSAHLANRLERPVEVCRFATSTAAGEALKAGAADFVLLDPAGFTAAGADARSLLTPRAPGSIGRILTIAAVPAGSTVSRLTDIKGQRFVFGGRGPAHLDGPRAALIDHGLPADAVASEQIAATPEQALAQMTSGAGDVLVLHASAWQRLCRPNETSKAPCAGLKEIFRGRERPDTAFAVRRDLDRDSLHRLVGILIALHLENRPAFDWLAPGAVELTPTEVGALAIGSSS